MPLSIFFVSDKAYNHLVHMAQVRGYVRWGTHRAKGLTEFLNDLSTMKFMDTRPILVRQRHEEEIQHNRAPRWLHTTTRRARALTLTELAIESYFKIAYQMGIIRTEPYAIGNVSKLTQQPAVSFVLEGIGLEWITPDSYPTKS